jgi:hypothetical protein
VFIARFIVRYALSPYIKQIRFVFIGLKFTASLPGGSVEGYLAVGLFTDGTQSTLLLPQSSTSPRSEMQSVATS